MRIESVRGIPLLAVLDEPQRTGVATYTRLGIALVQVQTDTGLFGYGECLARYSPRVWVAIVDDLLAPLVVGEDPFDTERLWTRMFRDLRSFSGHSRGMLVEAIAGVDTALWDIKGKAAALPVHALLGGVTRTSLDAYASSIMQRERSAMEAEAASLVERGFRAIKVKVGVGVEQSHPAGRRARRGISETRKIVDLAAAHHVAYAPHVGFSGAVCVAATLHLAASATNFLTYECIHTVNPLRERLAISPIGGPNQLVNGQIPIPTGPGLGVELDPDVLQRYRVAT